MQQGSIAHTQKGQQVHDAEEWHDAHVNLVHDATLGSAGRHGHFHQMRGLKGGMIVGIMERAIARLFIDDFVAHYDEELTTRPGSAV